MSRFAITLDDVRHGGHLMNFRANKRLLGLMLAPFALFTACAGLTPEEQAEYREIQEEVRRIQVEEIQPRQNDLNQIKDGKLVINVSEIQEQVNQIRNSRLEPLNKQLAALKTSDGVLAAPGTRIELEELNRRLDELMQLYSGMQAQITEHQDQLLAAKKAAAKELEEQISALRLELKVAESEDAAELIEAKIADLEEEIDARHTAIADQFGILIHTLEVSLHDISEEKEAVIREIHELELSAPEELEKTIDELENLIEQIVTKELRPLIERLNEATVGGDGNEVTREQLRAEIEKWLAKLTSLRTRMNELTKKSFQSMLGGLDLSALVGLAGQR